jgi:putative FmdB family regulatory protein
MPIYAYRCDACGHAKDVLQKISDPVLSTCPACGADAFRKQLTAAGFQLKAAETKAALESKPADAKAPEAKAGDTPPAASASAAPAPGGDAKAASSTAPAAGTGG